jgi:hypothetical protein
MSIWRLHIKASQHMSLIPHDLNYFRGRFEGARMPEDWKAPPITIAGRSKGLPDIMSWMTKAPLVSERTKLALVPVARECVQFLPFHELRGKRFFVMNVVRVERGLLDAQRSTIQYSKGEPREPLYLEAAVFKIDAEQHVPPIFKAALPEGHVFSEVFVTGKFADVAIEHRLTGFELADPTRENLSYVLAGKSQNVVPGIVG